MGYEVFQKLCEEKGVKPSQVSRATGVATATLTNWKKGGYTPKQDKLKAIADFFNVSLDYLVTGEEKEWESDTGKKYYFSDKTAELAQELHDNPHLYALMDAERNLSPEAAQSLITFITAQVGKEHTYSYAE